MLSNEDNGIDTNKKETKEEMQMLKPFDFSTVQL